MSIILNRVGILIKGKVLRYKIERTKVILQVNLAP